MTSEAIVSDRFVDTRDVTPACWTCVHKHSGAGTCDAFPTGIPTPILTGEHQHRDAYPGDGGIRYTRREKPRSTETSATP